VHHGKQPARRCPQPPPVPVSACQAPAQLEELLGAPSAAPRPGGRAGRLAGAVLPRRPTAACSGRAGCQAAAGPDWTHWYGTAACRLLADQLPAPKAAPAIPRHPLPSGAAGRSGPRRFPERHQLRGVVLMGPFHQRLGCSSGGCRRAAGPGPRRLLPPARLPAQPLLQPLTLPLPPAGRHAFVARHGETNYTVIAALML
jgi:hypothetical protein